MSPNSLNRRPEAQQDPQEDDVYLLLPSSQDLCAPFAVLEKCNRLQDTRCSSANKLDALARSDDMSACAQVPQAWTPS